MDNHSKESSLNQTNATGDVFDSGVVIVLLFSWLLCLGLAYNSGSSPMLVLNLQVFLRVVLVLFL